MKNATNRGQRRDEPETSRIEALLERFSGRVTRWTGGTWAFAIAFTIIVAWGVTGPIFGFSDTWQLVINTGTTIVTFLMVFLIQRSQNKDSMALQLKLNEIVAAIEGASNRLIDVEDLTEAELRTLHEHYRRLAEMAKKSASLTESHSLEEAEARHEEKKIGRKKRGKRAGAGPAGPDPTQAGD